MLQMQVQNESISAVACFILGSFEETIACKSLAWCSSHLNSKKRLYRRVLPHSKVSVSFSLGCKSGSIVAANPKIWALQACCWSRASQSLRSRHDEKKGQTDRGLDQNMSMCATLGQLKKKKKLTKINAKLGPSFRDPTQATIKVIYSIMWVKSRICFAKCWPAICHR